MFVRKFVLAIAFLTMPLSGATFKVSDMTKFWVESGITKDLLKTQISNAICFSTPQYLDSCRAAVAEFKRDVDTHALTLVDDDFDSILDAVDQLKDSPRPKEWILGQMLNVHLQTFDPHASFLPTAAFEALLAPGTDVRAGAGIKIMTTDSGVYVRMVLPNSPAQAAGFKVYDRLATIGTLEVGGGVAGQHNSELLSGKTGDTVEVGLDRAGTRLNVKLKIGPVSEQNVEAQKITYLGKKYSYLRLSEFKQSSCDALKDKVIAVKAQSVGLILDLRDNPGGIVEEAVCIAGLFVGQKDIVGQKIIDVTFPLEVSYRPASDGSISWEPNYRSAALADFPIVVLVNANTASAAEIVAGALQDYKAAWIVGERTFGKGSVQTVEAMKGNPAFDVAFTTALFYRPGGSSNQLAGVTPNFEVPMKRAASAADRRFPREADMFVNALKPPEGVSPFRETRPEVGDLRHCVEDSARDLAATAVFERKLGYEDYQRGYAIGLLECLPQSSQHNVSASAKK